MMHWAARYVGKRWAPDGMGPEAYSCWGLVCCVFRDVHGIEFSAITVDDRLPATYSAENVRAIKSSARASGMRPIDDAAAPEDGDIVLMQSLVRLHCGLVIRANGGLRVLHSAHGTGVVLEHWRDAVDGMTTQLWRRA